MRIHVEEDTMTDFAHTTFDLHLYDMTPEEYAEVRKSMNAVLIRLHGRPSDRYTRAPQSDKEDPPAYNI